MATAVLAALVLLTTTAYAKSGCSVATLKGNYALTFSGFSVVNNTSQPIYGEGLLTFDGAGNVAGTFNASFYGVPLLNVGYPATYSVNPDCTGVMNSTIGEDNFAFVILDNGSEIFLTDISPPQALNMVLKKQEHRGD
jgi:hypothetical protein